MHFYKKLLGKCGYRAVERKSLILTINKSLQLPDITYKVDDLVTAKMLTRILRLDQFTNITMHGKAIRDVQACMKRNIEKDGEAFTFNLYLKPYKVYIILENLTNWLLGYEK